MSSISRQQLEDYLKTLDIKADSVLDIGGSANPVEKRVNSWDVKEYHILDNNNEKGLHDKWIEPKFTGDIENDTFADKLFYNMIDKKIKPYDYIFLLEVSEYLPNFNDVLDNVNLLLKTGGKFIFSTHFIYPIHEPWKNDSIRFTEMGLRKLLLNVGFEKQKFIPRKAKNPELLMNFYRAEGMRPSKVIDHSIVGWIVEAEKC